jgi:hypothetical protein
MAVYTCSNCSTRSSPRNLRIYFVSTKRQCEHPSKHAAYFFTEHVSTNTPTKTILVIACNFRRITHNKITHRKIKNKLFIELHVLFGYLQVSMKSWQQSPSWTHLSSQKQGFELSAISKDGSFCCAWSTTPVQPGKQFSTFWLFFKWRKGQVKLKKSAFINRCVKTF